MRGAAGPRLARSAAAAIAGKRGLPEATGEDPGEEEEDEAEVQHEPKVAQVKAIYDSMVAAYGFYLYKKETAKEKFNTSQTWDANARYKFSEVLSS